jgi:hypothetical protein
MLARIQPSAVRGRQLWYPSQICLDEFRIVTHKERELMNSHDDDFYHDHTWFDELGTWLVKFAQRWRPRHPARLWSAGFAAFAALCVVWAAALATQCVLMELPRNESIAQWLAALLLLIAARHFLAVTGLSAASAIDERRRIKGVTMRQPSAEASAHIPCAAPVNTPSTVEHSSGDDLQRFFRAVKAAGINVRIAYALYAAGFRTAEQVRAAEDSALLVAPGIGPATLRKLRAQFGRPDMPVGTGLGVQSNAA